MRVGPGVGAFIVTWLIGPFLADFISYRLIFILAEPGSLDASFAEVGLTVAQARSHILSEAGMGVGMFATPFLLLYVVPVVAGLTKANANPAVLKAVAGFIAAGYLIWISKAIFVRPIPYGSSDIFWVTLVAMVPLVYFIFYSLFVRIADVQ